jgi:hypothetical protein
MLAVLVSYGVMLVCDITESDQPWRLEWTGGGDAWMCGCQWGCNCGISLRAPYAFSGCSVVVRGVPYSCWRHHNGCDVCFAELSVLTIDSLVETILPFFIEGSGRRLPGGATICGVWSLSYVWRRTLHHTLHRKVLRCLRSGGTA